MTKFVIPIKGRFPVEWEEVRVEVAPNGCTTTTIRPRPKPAVLRQLQHFALAARDGEEDE